MIKDEDDESNQDSDYSDDVPDATKDGVKDTDPEALMGIAGGLEFVSEAEMKLTQNKFKPLED